MHVETRGPADNAGVLLGDVIVEVAGETVENLGELQERVAAIRIGDSLATRLVRAGQIKAVSITLGEKAH
jgi:S1-C subfamily serine protease